MQGFHIHILMFIRQSIFSGFAFVYFDDERDADDAIRGLDGIPFGYSRRKLSVEWARGDRGPRHRDGARSAANTRPTKTLFVINFDPINTRVRDIERHFEPHGNVLNVRIRRNFAFVQFETQEDATKALEHTNMSKILDRVVSVEYALRDDDERGGRRDSPRRHHGDSPGDSPAHYRGRPSPDYGRRPSPDYGRRPSPDYGRPRSPAYERYDGPQNAYDRNLSPEPARYRRYNVIFFYLLPLICYINFLS
uniref:Arginine/serine-rich-splicing factor RSP31 n=1 Tax=Anthurium amnicola TaxID=1678845 RepID=A0A1D1Z537_9ARAE